MHDRKLLRLFSDQNSPAIGGSEIVVLGDEAASRRLAEKACNELFSENFEPREATEGIRLASEVSSITDTNFYDKNQFVFLIAGENLGDPEKEIIKGLSIGLYFDKSQTGAVWYLVVSKEHRREGIGDNLVKATDKSLEQMAALRQRQYQGLFVHIHDPDKEGNENDPFDPRARVKFYEGLEAVKAPIDFVSPSSDINGQVWPYMLVTMPKADGQYPSKTAVAGHVADYFRVYGHPEPNVHPHFRRMIAEIAQAKAFQPLSSESGTITGPNLDFQASS